MKVLMASVTALLTAGVVLVTAPASVAGTEKARDHHRDVMSGPYLNDDLPTRPEPARTIGDISRTKVTYGTDLVVATKYRSLQAGLIEQEFSWTIKTSDDEFPWSAVLVVPQGSHDQHLTFLDPIANQPGCASAVVDRQRGTVTLTVPADCLGNPKWVRVGNGAITYVEPTRTYYDDARRYQGVRHGWKLGPKVKALPSARAADRAALPEKVIVHDGRTSDPVVDISQVRLEASWYWDSLQTVRIKVPNGFRPGHRVTIYFDLDGDSTPDGHYDVRLMKPKRPGGKQLRYDDEFRLGGGWTLGGKGVRCSGSDGPPMAGGIRMGARTLVVSMDLWWCLQTPNPAGTDSGSWRAAVRVAKGKNADMAPDNRTWSKPVAGWGPCDPGGGQCP